MLFENFKKLVKENINFRKVVYTGKYGQLVLMSLPIGTDIGEETHPDTDQIFYFVEGEAEVMLNGNIQKIDEHAALFVPAGINHNITNTGDEDLKFFTVYAPPAHSEGTIHATKEEAK